MLQQLLLHRIRLSTGLLAMLAFVVLCPQLCAQADTGYVQPSTNSAAGSAYLGSTFLRVWHQTRGYGQEDSQTAIGGRAATSISEGLGFIDAQYKISNSGKFGMNTGIGYRWLSDDTMLMGPSILGVSGWYDGEGTEMDNYFNQLGISLESLGDIFDLRLNASFPLDSDKLGTEVIFSDEITYSGNILGFRSMTPTEQALRVIDLEGAMRIEYANIWLYAGGYQMDGTGISDFGYKAGARGYLFNDLMIEVGATEDDTFGTNFRFAFIYTPGRTSPRLDSWNHTLEDRIREPVYRNNYIARNQTILEKTSVLTDLDGNPFQIVHVDSNAVAPGDGTFENPLTSLNDVLGTSSQGDIVLVHADSTYNGQSVVLQDEQRFLGEGGNQTHTIVTSQLGNFILPETFAGALTGAIPVIQNAPGDAITLAPGSVNVESLSGIEVSNLAIDGGARGISAPTGVANVDINRMTISNTTGDGINLTPLVETLSDSSPRVRFNPNIDLVTFDNIGGDDIELDATTAEPSTTPVVEAIVVSSVTSTNGSGAGVNLINNKSTARIVDYEHDGSTTATSGISITNAEGNVVISNATITGGAGTGIALTNSDGSHTFMNVEITDTLGTGLLVSGGDADLDFMGKITQNENAAALMVQGGHTGSLEFSEQTANAGIVEATNGTGLQFNNADGVYTFNDNILLSGGDAGIDLLNDTDGNFTIADAIITSPTGTAINVDTGSASMNFTGSILQANNAAVLSVSGGHNGTLVFNELVANTGVINATNGNGLQFNNADGAYLFNDAVTLNGGDAGLDLLNDSDGNFTFANIAITNPTGVGVNVDGGSSILTFTGHITQSNNASAVAVSGGHNGTLIFNESTANAGVIDATNGNGLQFNNADGSYAFTAGVDLHGGDAGIDILAGSGGTFTFDADSSILNPTGDAFVVNASSATVTYDGTISTDASRPVVVTNNTGGAIQFNGQITSTGQGIQVDNNSGGNTRFAGNVDLDTGFNTAVSVSNNSGGSVRFDDIQINTTFGTGFQVANSNSIEVTGTGNTIETTTGVALDMSNSTVGANNVNFQSVSVDGAGNAIILNELSGGSVNIGANGSSFGDGGTLQNVAGQAVILTNVANVSLNNMDIDTIGANAITINHTGASAQSVTIADSRITNTSGIGIDLNASGAGTLTFVADTNTINTTNGAGMDLDIAEGASVANLTVDGNTITNTSGNEALLIAGSGATSKTINLLVQNNTLTNDDPTAVGTDIQANGAINLNATLLNNTFENSDLATGRPMEISANDASSVVRVSMFNNTATAGSGGDGYFLIQNAGTFTLEDRTTASPDNVEDLNTGTFNFTGTIGNDPGNIPLP